MDKDINKLKLKRLGIDTKNEFIVFVRADSFICKSEGFAAATRIFVCINQQKIIASLNIIQSDILRPHEASLSESAWQRLDVKEGDEISLSPIAPPIDSLRHLRSKIYGHQLNAHEFEEIIFDIVAGKYSNVHLASFITACANDLTQNESLWLTQAMIKAGQTLSWPYKCILDKHSIGGIPGNRTTPIVVAIVAAAGLIIPKTSSRSITSPAGTADTVEVITHVDLNIPQMRKVVEQEGGCLVWGGAIGLSPADDIIIKVERSLDIDPIGQMVASILSKKASVGTTHVVIDIPVGNTAKIRSQQAFEQLRDLLLSVGNAIGVNIVALQTDGSQPLGKGIGPALEAKDILAVLNNEKNAPADLKAKSLYLAGALLELGKKANVNEGVRLASQLLSDGTAFKKFLAICQAQGAFNEPPTASYTYEILAEHEGIIAEINNRNLAMIAKLAGAPHDAAAGIEFFSRLGTKVEKDQLLYRIHAESKNALEYALKYVHSVPDVIVIRRE